MIFFKKIRYLGNFLTYVTPQAPMDSLKKIQPIRIRRLANYSWHINIHERTTFYINIFMVTHIMFEIMNRTIKMFLWQCRLCVMCYVLVYIIIYSDDDLFYLFYLSAPCYPLINLCDFSFSLSIFPGAQLRHCFKGVGISFVKKYILSWK